MRLFIIFLLISPSAFAAYTTMTIEGVKQANGVWTAAGVMDSSGFVRTTGAVTVYGTTRNLPVKMAVNRSIASSSLKTVAGRLGPYGIAALGAMEVYDYFNSNDAVPCDGDTKFCFPVDPSLIDPTYTYGKYYDITMSGVGNATGSSVTQACTNVASMSSGIYKMDFTSYNPSTSRCYFTKTNGTSTNGYVYIRTCPPASTLDSCLYPINPKDPKPVYYSDSDFLNLPDPSWPVLSDGYSHIPQLGNPPISSTDFTPFSEWMGDPYFKDGNWWRDRMDVSPSSTTSSPTRVRIDIGPVKIVGATNPETVPDTGPAGGTGGAPQPEKEKPTFCEENPFSIACQEMGELKQEPFDPVEKPFQITPQNPWGSGDSQCPAPKVMQLSTGSTVTLSYQPACDFFRGVRPAVLALAFLAALYIALGIPVGKGD
ncbi:virulence factor TspB C-terminal domain-related protein [Aeromonas veronii]